MKLFKKIDAEKVLYAVAALLSDEIPGDAKKVNAGIHLEFNEDHSVEVYIDMPQEDKTLN